MLNKINLLMAVGLSLFVTGIVLPFVDVYIIKSIGKSAISIGYFLLFLSIAFFIVGVALTLLCIRKENKN